MKKRHALQALFLHSPARFFMSLFLMVSAVSTHYLSTERTAEIEEWRSLFQEQIHKKLYAYDMELERKILVLKEQPGDYLIARVQDESQVREWLLNRPLEDRVHISQIGLFRQGKHLLMRVDFEQQQQFSAQASPIDDGIFDIRVEQQ